MNSKGTPNVKYAIVGKDIGCFRLGVFLMGKTREKVVLIGSVYPYKGGISHYTEWDEAVKDKDKMMRLIEEKALLED